MKLSIKIFILFVFIQLNSITYAQYFNDYDAVSRQLPPPTSELKSNDVEQKYVNNGQSVLLVCDLPNQMPDGKVSPLLFISF